MSKNFETMIKNATSQFFAQIQNELAQFVWEKINQQPSKEALSQAISEFFGEKIEKPVEKVEKPKKTKKAEHTCERKYVPSGEKNEVVCGNNATEQKDGVWVCGKHKTAKPKSSSNKKKPASLFDGVVGQPVPKKVVGELPNETIPPELENLVADMDGKISEQIDNYINVVEKDIPKEIVEDKPVEKPVVKNVEDEPKKEEKPEEKKPKKKVQKEEVLEPKKVEVEEKTEPLMRIPTLEEMEKEEEAPKKKKIIKRVKKVKPVVQGVADPALAALDE